jgi:serine/threonine protein kinase
VEGKVRSETDVAPGDLSSLLGQLARAPAAELGGGWERWLRPGGEVGPYELVREIGRGGFGVVWEANDSRTGNRVAFKAVRAGSLAAVREERLLAEAEVAARLAHPSIVELLDMGRTERGPFLVYELLRGGTLGERMAGGPVPLEEAIRIGTSVAAAIAHAHARGVVHRDLTPGNVFLCGTGEVKVLDFGLAHAFGQRRAGGGTPTYMAPEQWRGAPEDERTDVFALGVILFRMLAGELPFDGRTGCGSPGAFPAPALDVPRAPFLAELVARMLDADPVARPRDGEEVAISIRKGAATIGPASADLGPVSVLRRFAAGHPAADPRAAELVQRARQFLRHSRKASYRFAREMFARAASIDPGYALAQAGEAESIALLKNYYPHDETDLAAADRASARAVELDPGLAEARAARGFTLFLLGRRGEARQELDRAIALDPRLGEARYYAGRVAFQEGRFADAARQFDEANRCRENPDAAMLAAQALEAQGLHEEAMAASRAALGVIERHMELHPDDPRAATQRAVTLLRLGRAKEGLGWAAEALMIDPRDAGVLYNVGCVRALSGDVEGAIQALTDVIHLGLTPREWLERDPDLDSLRADPRFQALLASI